MPPPASPSADGGSPSRPPLAGVAKVCAPSSLPIASTGDASGEGSEPSVAHPANALSPVLGAVPRSAADAPEAASSAGSADSQPQDSVSGSGAPGDCACSAADAPEASFAAPGCLAFPLSDERASRTSSPPAPILCLWGTSSTFASAMPAAFTTFLEELGALQLGTPPPPSTSGSSEASLPTPPAFSGTSCGATTTSGSSTSLTVDSDTSDDSGPVIPSFLHKGKGKRPAKSSTKLRSAPSPPKKKQRLGRPSVDLKARKAAKQAASAAVSGSGPSQSVPSSLPTTSVSTSSAPVSGIAVSADSAVLSFASIPSGWDPPFSPIPRTPPSPASSTASTASLSSTPVVSRGITPGTVASVPVGIGGDGGSGADGAAYEASVAPGGVFSSPVVSQPRRDGQPTRAASTTAGRRSMAAAKNEAAAGALVLGLATPPRTPAATRASMANSASTPDPVESATVVAAAPAAVVTSASARRRVANTHTGPVPPARVVATPTPRQASAPRARAHSDLGFALWERAHWISVAAVEQWLRQLSDRIGSDTPDYLETETAWRAYNKARNLRADRFRLQIPKRFWIWCTPDAGGKIKCPPDILLEPSMSQDSFETLTWAPSTAAWTVEVGVLDARQPWRNGWVGLPAEHPFNTTFTLCTPAAPHFIPEGPTREEVGVAIVMNPVLMQSHVTAPWLQEFSDAQAQAVADAPRSC
ncbi:unnamed protein product [Phytophthora fragariaefolia]|uniref:Unnamed protein product n=1 Tax=Phytophthora fragariaefolia TaxID=1490495 RepID=A0A9W6XNS8_9STRA|nr:unnamed protein product [Phytophthora fragariaefolia]